MSATPGPLRSFALALAALAVGGVLSLALLEVASRLLFPQWREFATERFLHSIDVPGYARFAVGKPGFDGYFAHNAGDYRIHIRINGFGLRNDEPVEDAAGRLWAVGDSFTFGWGVERDEIFDRVAARELGIASYSVASPGTNICGYQALLARMPAGLAPAAAVVGLTLENDIHDYDGCKPPAANVPPAPERFNLMALKGLLTSHSAAYNFLAVALKRAQAVQALLMQAGLLEREHIDRSGLSADSLGPAIASSADELARLKGMLPPGTPFAVLLIPGRTEIKDGNPLIRQLRLQMGQALAARGIEVVDPIEPVARLGLHAAHFAHDGHWSAAGHAAAGKMVAAWLAAHARHPIPEETRK